MQVSDWFEGIMVLFLLSSYVVLHLIRQELLYYSNFFLYRDRNTGIWDEVSITVTGVSIVDIILHYESNSSNVIHLFVYFFF